MFELKACYPKAFYIFVLFLNLHIIITSVVEIIIIKHGKRKMEGEDSGRRMNSHDALKRVNIIFERTKIKLNIEYEKSGG